MEPRPERRSESFGRAAPRYQSLSISLSPGEETPSDFLKVKPWEIEPLFFLRNTM